MDKQKRFIEKVHKLYGDEIDTSKVNYITCNDKVCLICHKKDKYGNQHGEYWQLPSACIRGNKCPKCANERRGASLENRMTTEKFIQKSNEVHNNEYDYSKLKYVDANTKVCITCKKHGDFYQLPFNHLGGHKCPKCRGKNLTNEEVINRFREIHGDKYNYSKVEYKDNKTKICIVCPIHGEFWQTPSKHLIGRGCPKCGNIKKNQGRKISFDEFVNRSKDIHGDKYEYVNTTLNSLHDKVDIICEKHGIFTQNAYDHLNGHGCPACGYNISNAENEIASFIKEALHIENVEQRNKNIIPPYEIDIYLPDYKIGIEYNGLVWHSEKFGKDKDYHLNKLNRCNDNDIKLIQIFEDEYIEHKEIIFEKIRHILGKDINKNKIYARKCDVNIIEKKEAMIFLNDNHIQGYNPSTVYLGCFYENKLIAVMTFKEERKGSGLWELNRFASDIHNHCIGVGGKLFKYFIKNYYPIQVKSFADRRWTLSSDDNLYTNLGFTLDKILKPDYSYVTSKGCRVHKFNFRKKNIIHKYKEYNLNMDMTEKEMADIIGVFKIWDCGLYKYIWKR